MRTLCSRITKGPTNEYVFPEDVKIEEDGEAVLAIFENLLSRPYHVRVCFLLTIDS